MKISVLILTLNEAPNIGRTLGKLSWADDIVVLDSGSTDATRDIASGHPGVRVIQHAFTTLAEQWNFGLEQTGIATDWVLALDADYLLSDELIHELPTLDLDGPTTGYRASFVYCIEGKPLRGAAYPPVVVLFKRSVSTVMQDGHAQRVRVNGPIAPLRGRIFHDDRKSLTQWLASQAGYMRLEVAKLAAAPAGSLGLLDRLRQLIVIAPPAMFFYSYVVRLGFLDGRAGLFYALQRAAAELILSLYLIDSKLGSTARAKDRS